MIKNTDLLFIINLLLFCFFGATGLTSLVGAATGAAGFSVAGGLGLLVQVTVLSFLGIGIYNL